MGIKAFGHGDDFVNKFVRAIVSDSTGLDAVNPEPVPAPQTQASGGVISDYTDPGSGNVYRSHIFTDTGTFSVTEAAPDVTTADFLLVAGGGGGGDNIVNAHGGNGGGGAGGYVEGNALPIADGTTFTITIGGGGSSLGNGNGTPTATARNGTNSTIAGPTITTVTAKGGGGGGNDHYDVVADGGSGGGSWGGGGAGPTTHGDATQPGTNSLYGATDYGNVGGHTPSASPEYCGSGGGGAGSVGGNSPNGSTGGDGGDGRASTIAYGPSNPRTYATGGAGGNTPYGGTNGSAAPNGGAATGESGLYSTGGGGGGCPEATANSVNGGSGIAVIRYQMGSIQTQKATGGAVSYYGGKTIHVFSYTGTFSSDNPFNETCECIIIGGGAGTGNPATTGAHGPGGGGAGNVIDRNNVSLNVSGPWTFNVQVGGGGAAGGVGSKGSAGTPSFAGFPSGTLTAPGGGAGGVSVDSLTDGNPGGAGGGASNFTSGGTGGNGDGVPWPGTPGNDPGSGWGADGGDSTVASPAYGGGGGGGALDGQDGSSSQGGDGGGGYKIPTTYQDPAATLGYAGPGSTHFWFAGGGGGGIYEDSSGNEGVGGAGPDLNTPYAGAGNGSYRSGPPGHRGQANSGSGAGGGGGGNAAYGADGGSGIVIIAYPT